MISVRSALAVLLVLSLMGSFPRLASAASSFQPPTLYGIHAGPAGSVVHFPSHEVHSASARIGASGGLHIVIPRSRHSSLQLGGMLRTAGGTCSSDWFDPTTGPTGSRTTFELTYLTIPIGLRISRVSRTSGPFLTMGADVAYLLAYHQHSRSSGSEETWSSSERGLAHPWGLGGFVALGLARSTPWHGLFGELTYRHGLAPFQKSHWGGSGAPDDGTDRGLSLSLGAWL